ncbi:MAG: SRPBCC domain-containing protein [Phycisphaerales bacterium]|nr:SRPBCC domain-containing protein [Phycisphaerales bacterium]
MRGRTTTWAACGMGALMMGGVVRADLAPAMERWEPMLGVWTIHATWSFGATLDAKAEYREGVEGRFVHARTWVSDNGGPTYLRYETTICPGESTEGETYDLHSFIHDGRVDVRAWEVEERDEGAVFVAHWEMPNGAPIREEMRLVDAETLTWKVWSRPDASAAWDQIMDGSWTKLGGEEDDVVAMPIDSSSFEGAGDTPRQFTVTGHIAAPVEAVYRAWTHGDAFRRAFAPEREALGANIDLAIGGRYEWLFDGVTGSNGCQVLSYIPNRMVSFSWNAPPAQSTRGRHTWVVVEFEPAEGDATDVTLTHLGFGEGEAWDETFTYFQNAWPFVMESFRSNLEKAPG